MSLFSLPNTSKIVVFFFATLVVIAGAKVIFIFQLPNFNSNLFRS